ncbi:MAG: hypothetical protein WA847_06920, partial [Terriglobales bacterium]
GWGQVSSVTTSNLHKHWAQAMSKNVADRFLNRWSAVRLRPGPPSHLTEASASRYNMRLPFRERIAPFLPGKT